MGVIEAESTPGLEIGAGSFPYRFPGTNPPIRLDSGYGRSRWRIRRQKPRAAAGVRRVISVVFAVSVVFSNAPTRGRDLRHAAIAALLDET